MNFFCASIIIYKSTAKFTQNLIIEACSVIKQFFDNLTELILFKFSFVMHFH